jgi:hypothetical protein
MKKIVFVILLFMMCFPIFSEKLAVLKEITRPSFDIVMDRDQFYVVEGAHIFIYSLKDYTLMHTFGQKGEGPGEFKLGTDEDVYIVPKNEHLIIESDGKLSYFTREGQFLKDVKIPFRGYNLMQPLGDKMVGFKDEANEETKTYYKILYLFTPDLEKYREVCRSKHNYQQAGFTVLRGTFLFKVHQNKIFVSYWGGDFIMDCFDQEGNRLFLIEDKKFEKRKTSADDIRRIHDYFKTYFEGYYARNRDAIRIEKNWPAIGTFFLDGDRLYILTYVSRETGRVEEWLVYIYDIGGKFIKKLYLPLKEQDVWQVYPATFYGGKLYQLLENEETEEWELHAMPID